MNCISVLIFILRLISLLLNLEILISRELRYHYAVRVLYAGRYGYATHKIGVIHVCYGVAYVYYKKMLRVITRIYVFTIGVTRNYANLHIAFFATRNYG